MPQKERREDQLQMHKGKRKGYLFNRLSNRLVKKDGAVGKWIKGGKHPKIAGGPSYKQELGHKYIYY